MYHGFEPLTFRVVAERFNHSNKVVTKSENLDGRYEVIFY